MSKKFQHINDICYVNIDNRAFIGKGSSSKVCLVYHRNDPNKLYAMKEFIIGTQAERKFIFQEINLHIQLRHKNIIRFEDYIEVDNKIYLFLEYAENGNLFTYMKNFNLSEELILRFFYQVCLAIEYIHSKDIMHRDIKPENILLDSQLNIKLCDFGWSARYSETESRKTLCGTYEYMAPEVFYKNNQTKKTDIWALGILLYELFHGHAPFRGTRMDTIIYAIKNNFIMFKKYIPERMKQMIIRILMFDPQKRPSISEILNNDIFISIKEKQLTETNNNCHNIFIDNQESLKKLKNKIKSPILIESNKPNNFKNVNDHETIFTNQSKKNITHNFPIKNIVSQMLIRKDIIQSKNHLLENDWKNKNCQFLHEQNCNNTLYKDLNSKLYTKYRYMSPTYSSYKIKTYEPFSPQPRIVRKYNSLSDMNNNIQREFTNSTLREFNNNKCRSYILSKQKANQCLNNYINY